MEPDDKERERLAGGRVCARSATVGAHLAEEQSRPVTEIDGPSHPQTIEPRQVERDEQADHRMLDAASSAPAFDSDHTEPEWISATKGTVWACVAHCRR